jgi:hypothetical protein
MLDLQKPRHISTLPSSVMTTPTRQVWPAFESRRTSQSGCRIKDDPRAYARARTLGLAPPPPCSPYGTSTPFGSQRPSAIDRRSHFQQGARWNVTGKRGTYNEIAASERLLVRRLEGL